jgi:type II secretory pathway pseudopilin PulG
MAITVIVIIATIMALALALTSQTTKRTKDLYLYEQSVLMSRSAAEYALLKISLLPPCSALDTNATNFTQDGIYNISIKVRYIYDSNASCIAHGGTLYTTVDTPEQNGSVLLDVTVDINDTSVATEPIRYFRRTIQKL